MADLQLENRYTQIPNEILEPLAKLLLSPNGWKVLMCVIRKTYGFHKKVDRIANIQIVEATGLRKDTVSRALHELREKAVIERNGKHIGLQENPQRWKFAESSTFKSWRNRKQKLAESQTKVGGSLVTQKKKETIKENNDKNGYSAIALSAIKEYFKTYKEKTGKPHPNLHPTQLVQVTAKISDEFKRLRIKRVKEAKKLVAAHFERSFQRDFRTDWNINHFASGSIIEQLWESPSCAIFREKKAAALVKR